MPFLTTRRILSRIFPDPARLPTAGVRDLPEPVVLPVRDGVEPSGKPPVRIYLGTEAGQHRAERVFVHSIERVRDPARVYEVHLMKDVRGYDRRWWLTGFTNYRFAIATWAGSTGRAIYNDVDQIWLSDPAELFDSDMGGKGFLALTQDDTAVMLIDCERMARIWTRELVSATPRKRIEKLSRHEWGKLEACWHARDFDYVPGYSKCLHFTTIHEQPWHPCPELFVYMPSPVHDIWHDAERVADAADYSLFRFATPSTLYVHTLARLRNARQAGAHQAGASRAVVQQAGASRAVVQQAGASRAFVLDIGVAAPPLSGLGDLLAQADAHSILEFTLAGPLNEVTESRVGKYPGATLTTYDPSASGGETVPAPTGPFDAVTSLTGLDLLSDEDIPWVIDELFRRAHRAVFLTVDDIPRSVALAEGDRLEVKPRGFAWWRAQVEAASRKRPDVRWRLGVRRRTLLGAETVDWREAGRRLRDEPPRVWILADPKPGHTTQSVGLSEALGWPCEVKDVGFPTHTKVTDRLLGPLAFDRSGRRAAVLQPPWPDLVISTGWSTGPIARWIVAQSDGRTSVVQMGRKGGDVAANFDLVATCSYVRYPPHERRIALAAPLNQVTRARLDEAAARWPDLFGSHPSPRLVVLLGGNCAQYELDDESARRLGRDVAAMARKAGGSVVVVTSRRSPESAVAILEREISGNGAAACGEVHRWRADRSDNPFLGYLAGADALVVTGESESMLAEACSTGKPVYIFPLKKKAPSLGQRLTNFVTAVAFSRPRKGKGTIRPQQGREYFCARLIERGIVHPARDLEAFHRGLVEAGHAKMFDGKLELGARPALHEADLVAARVRTLLGCSDDEGPALPSTREPAHATRTG